MAAAFFDQLTDRHKAELVSAGTEPGLRAHPKVLAVVQPVGNELSEAKPQNSGDWRGKRNCSSEWTAETNASFQGCAGMTGL